MTTEPVEWTHPGADYRERLPRMLRDTLTGPNGEPCFTPTDRRWLWRLETFFAVSATTEVQRQMGADLQCYLRETCEHHWDGYGTDELGVPDQCVWCSTLREVEQP